MLHSYNGYILICDGYALSGSRPMMLGYHKPPKGIPCYMPGDAFMYPVHGGIDSLRQMKTYLEAKYPKSKFRIAKVEVIE